MKNDDINYLSCSILLILVVNLDVIVILIFNRMLLVNLSPDSIFVIHVLKEIRNYKNPSMPMVGACPCSVA